MRGIVQPGGRPLGGSELRSYFFAVCGPKYNKLGFCGGVRSLQCCFPIVDVLLRSGDIRDQVAKLCEIAPKFTFFWAAKFGGRGPRNFWRNFVNLGHHGTCDKVLWRSAKRPRRLSGGKKEDRNYSGRTEWPARAAIINEQRKIKENRRSWKCNNACWESRVDTDYCTVECRCVESWTATRSDQEVDEERSSTEGVDWHTTATVCGWPRTAGYVL